MKTASRADASPGQSNLIGYKSTSLWLGVSAGFLVLVLAWGVLFFVARLTQVESVPLATKEAKP